MSFPKEVISWCCPGPQGRVCGHLHISPPVTDSAGKFFLKPPEGNSRNISRNSLPCFPGKECLCGQRTPENRGGPEPGGQTSSPAGTPVGGPGFLSCPGRPRRVLSSPSHQSCKRDGTDRSKRDSRSSAPRGSGRQQHLQDTQESPRAAHSAGTSPRGHLGPTPLGRSGRSPGSWAKSLSPNPTSTTC